MDRPFNVLFLCTGNSARSIMAEAILNREGARKLPRFFGRQSAERASASLHAGPAAQDEFRRERLRSKSWDEFSGAGAAPLDFVFTVCDNAAGEACPYLARPADDRPLGRSRSGRRDRQ